MFYKILYIDKDLDGIIKNYSHNGSIYPLVKVPFTLVGDIISVVDIEIKSIPVVKKFVRKNDQIAKIKVPCQYYERCGGCKGQHFSKTDYIKIKLDNVMRNFEANHIKIQQDIVVLNHIDDPFYHRRRAIFSVSQNKLGFNSYRTNNVIEIEHCLLLKKEINNIIPLLQDLAGKVPISSLVVTTLNHKLDICIISNKQFLPQYALFLQDLCIHESIANISWKTGRDVQSVIQKAQVSVQYGNKKISFPSGGFLQASDFGEQTLQKLVIDNINDNSQYILDLFCGLGSYTLSILDKKKYVEHITAIDANSQAISALRKLNDKHITPITRDVMKHPMGEKELQHFDTLIVNPPRVGAKEQIQKIAKANISRIILVYCSLSSLIRDLKILLLDNTKYKIDTIYLIDQFIYSPHIEVVVILSLCNTSNSIRDTVWV